MSSTNLTSRTLTKVVVGYYLCVLPLLVCLTVLLTTGRSPGIQHVLCLVPFANYGLLGVIILAGNEPGILPALLWFGGAGLVLIPWKRSLQSWEREQAAEHTRLIEAERVARARENDIKRKSDKLRALALDAQAAALSLPSMLTSAELTLDQAEAECKHRRTSLFWEAMESASLQLTRVRRTQAEIAKSWREYNSGVAELPDDQAPEWSLGVSALPDAALTAQRLKEYYHAAHADRDFIHTFEQRRTTAEVQLTNKILMEGFTSLIRAVRENTDAIRAEGQSLRSDLGLRCAGLEEALRESQRSATAACNGLSTEIRTLGKSGLSMVGTLERHVARREQHGRDALKMLDNIQLRRKPHEGGFYKDAR